MLLQYPSTTVLLQYHSTAVRLQYPLTAVLLHYSFNSSYPVLSFCSCAPALSFYCYSFSSCIIFYMMHYVSLISSTILPNLTLPSLLLHYPFYSCMIISTPASSFLPPHCLFYSCYIPPTPTLSSLLSHNPSFTTMTVQFPLHPYQ